MFTIEDQGINILLRVTWRLALPHYKDQGASLCSWSMSWMQVERTPKLSLWEYPICVFRRFLPSYFSASWWMLSRDTERNAGTDRRDSCCGRSSPSQICCSDSKGRQWLGHRAAKSCIFHLEQAASAILLLLVLNVSACFVRVVNKFLARVSSPRRGPTPSSP